MKVPFKWIICNFILIFSFIIICTSVVYGANLSDMIVSGDDIFNKQPKSYIVASSTYFSRVPDSVIHLFIKQGGTINYTDDTLVGKKDINGIYIYESKKIILKVNEVNSTWDEVEKAPVHEIGHFIYQMTLPNFTEQMQVDLATLYSERKSFDPRCTNEDETFAALYSDYIKYNYKNGTYMMPRPEYRIFEQAERICELM